jgi:hypothetical protein
MADHSKTGHIVRFLIQNGRQSHLKAGHKKRPRDGHSKAGPSGFWWGTVFGCPVFVWLLYRYISRNLKTRQICLDFLWSGLVETTLQVKY